jgi:hypothetical protein
MTAPVTVTLQELEDRAEREHVKGTRPVQTMLRTARWIAWGFYRVWGVKNLYVEERADGSFVVRAECSGKPLRVVIEADE